MRFLYSSSCSKKFDPNCLFNDVSKISRKKVSMLSLSYFLTRLRMRERQIEIKRISLFLSRNRCSDTVICPWKIEKRDSYEHTISFTNRPLYRIEFHEPCKRVSIQRVYGQNTIATGYILTG